MLTEQDKRVIEKGLLTLWIIWAAIMGSLFIYVFICHQFGDEVRRNMSQNIPLDTIRNVLYGIAFITLFLTQFVKKLILTGKSIGSFSNASKSGLNPNQPQFLAKYNIALIITLALSESIGIYGLLLFLLGDSFQTLYIFIGVSALAIFYHRPKREELETLAIAIRNEETPTSTP